MEAKGGMLEKKKKKKEEKREDHSKMGLHPFK